MPKLTRVAPEIPVTDLEESLAYYKIKLGFELAMKMPGGGYAIVERDDVALHLFQDSTKSQSPVSIHVFTTGIEELYTEIEKRGARIIHKIAHQPWGNRDFRIGDPSGNEIKFTEPLAEEAWNQLCGFITENKP
jgi:uncharacterized glyoxalase superfamily protein PhnB